jgi:hypothetical protein
MYMGISQNPGTPKNIWLMDVYSLKYGENSFNPLPYTVVTFGKGHLFSIDDHFALLFGMTSTFDGICMDILYLDGDVWVVPYLSNLFGTYVFVSNPQKMDECFQGVDDGFHIFQDSNNSFQINFFWGLLYYVPIYIYTVFSSWHVPIFFGRDSEKHWLLRYPTCSSIWAIPRWSCWRGARKRS